MSGCSRQENGRELRTITGSIPTAREPSGYRGRSRLEGDDVDGSLPGYRGRSCLESNDVESSKWLEGSSI